MNRTLRPALAACALVSFAACGGEPAPPPAPPTPPMPTAAAAAEPPPPPTAEPSAAPSASASAEPQKPMSSGRPPVIFTNATEVSETFGSSPPAKVEIGGDKDHAIFRIPENALHQGMNITFKLDTRGRSGGGQVGKIYRITPIIPPDAKPVNVETADAPFVIQLSNGGKKDLNLAIGALSTDDKGREKIVWTIVAPKQGDNGAGEAVFEVKTLGDEYVHLTTKPPAAGK
ncbi:MAG TPA: hypothetical protein VHB21_28445 [Minicystis sp.]|nr:hypothetical protein [Minicystis sp.]